MLEYLEKLSELSGPSGDESRVVEYIASVVRPYVDELYTDELGTLYAVKHRGERRVMLDAHTDEIAVIVTEIRQDGTLNYHTHLGNDPRILLGKTVSVGPNCIPGVFRLKNENRYPRNDEYLGHDKLCIDIGTSSREAAEKYVTIGDYACFSTKLERRGDLIAGKAFDDRCGCAIIMEMLKNDYPCELHAVFTVQEEIGTRGATAAAYSVKPDMALVLETTTACDIAGVEGEKKVCELSKGAVVSYMDRSTIYDRELYKLAFDTARELDIPCQTKTKVAGGTDAGSYTRTAGGTKVTGIAVPTRYIHSASCVAKKCDIEATEKLVYAVSDSIPDLL